MLKFVPCFKFGELNKFDRSSMSRLQVIEKTPQEEGPLHFKLQNQLNRLYSQTKSLIFNKVRLFGIITFIKKFVFQVNLLF